MNLAETQNKTEKQVAFGSLSGFLAFGFGSGLSPKAPGTMGTLAAIPLAWVLVMLLSFPAYLAVLILMFVLGVYICERSAAELGAKDPGGIVWDEIVGFCLCVTIVPLHWAWWLAAFLAFRLFDILKPWPVRWAERRFRGGLGIMADDIVAAVYSLLLLLFAQRILSVIA